MKIGISTDWHGHAPSTQSWPKTDLHIVCGDITPNWTWNFWDDRTKQLDWIRTTFYKWCEHCKAEQVIYITGNHDMFQMMPEWKDENAASLEVGSRQPICIDNMLFNYRGISLYGFPWTQRLPSFDVNDWSYGYKDDADLVRMNVLPQLDKLDIFVGHGACYQILDRTHDNVLTGSKVLRDYIKTLKPKYSLNGHIHEDSGIKTIDGITYINSYYGLTVIDI